MVAERLVQRVGFTPTDALHACDRLDLWNAEAGQLGAQVLAAQGRCSVRELCQAVVEGVSNRAARSLVSKVLRDEGGLPPPLPDWEREPTARLLLERALNDGHGPVAGEALGNELTLALTLRRPVVAIGAPVEAYMPRVTQSLHTGLIIPPHAHVANAVGAVTGGVVQRQRVLITPLDDESLRLHLPEGVRDFAQLEAAVTYARDWMQRWMEAQARSAGAAQVEVQMARHDRQIPVRMGWGERLYLGTELIFTAAGRPSPAVRLEER
jgi:N-methylhydantoinase A/oxoprolinase/acetone carboxylase beta subunit